MTHKQQAEIRLRTNDLSIDFGNLKAMGKVYLIVIAGRSGYDFGIGSEGVFCGDGCRTYQRLDERTKL